MAESNGHQDGSSRLDRIEAAIEHIIGEHESFRAEHQMLLRSQVLLQDSLMGMQKAVEVLRGSLEDLKVRVAEIGDKLDGLIGVVDHDHREFHERLKRLEEKH
jgi:hypothetical protein